MGERKRILFVEDDPVLLDLLRESMADMAPVWAMSFVDSGEAALVAFEKSPFHAVVSDLWMPGMNGAQLLQKVMVRYPATLRFVLSGCADRSLATAVVDRAHQVLCKPCDPAFLKSVLRRTFHLGSQVHNDHARELVARIGRLPSVPALYQEITRLMGSERATLEDLGAAIGRDIAMTAMILKLSNSAFFSLRQDMVTKADKTRLGADAQIDYDILRNALDLELMRHESLLPWQYSPIFYNQIFTNSLHSLLTKQHASLDVRMKSAIERAKAIPGLVKQAKANLQTPPQIYTETAVKQRPGILDFYRVDLPKLIEAAPADMKSRFQAESSKAVAALEDYQSFLQTQLLPKSTGNFRLGEQAHSRLLTLTSEFSIPAQELVEDDEDAHR
ncbi:MAG: DUF885 family protein, partial [Holophaga sp.]|nr:DUF885 family protein [Holophaga sp.]